MASRRWPNHGEVLHVRRELEHERTLGVDAALGAVELPEDRAAAVLFLELLDVDVLAAERRRVLRHLDDVVGVRCDEGRAVIGLDDLCRDNLLGHEVFQIDDRDARVGLVTDEQELPVVVAGRLRERRVMRVGPREIVPVAPAAGEHALGLIVEAVSLPGLGREDADVPEDAHRRHADDDDLPAVSARREDVILVVLAGGRVRLECRADVCFRQTAGLHELL